MEALDTKAEDSKSDDSVSEFIKSFATTASQLLSKFKQLEPSKLVTDQPSTSGLRDTDFKKCSKKTKSTAVKSDKKKGNNTPKKVSNKALDMPNKAADEDCGAKLTPGTGENDQIYLSNIECSKPSTTGIPSSTKKKKLGKTKGISTRTKKRNNSAGPQEVSESKQSKMSDVAVSGECDKDYSPPITRNYAKLSHNELSNLSKRIQIFNDTGVVISEAEVYKIKPCKNRREKQKDQHSVKELGQQVPGTHFGKGNIGANCSAYGVPRCVCCNKSKSKHLVKENYMKEIDLNNSTSCSAFGILDCDCCPKDKTDSEVVDSLEMENHLSISQIQLPDHEIGDCSNEHTNIPGLPTVPISKQKLIQKYLDSLTHDRIDYSKPKKKNIVEGLIHNPVTYYSENLCEEVDAPEKTILARVDFQKERERLARLSLLLSKGYTSSQNPSMQTPNFKDDELAATSTPQPVIRTLSYKTDLSPIEGDLSTNTPDKPTENLQLINDTVPSSLDAMKDEIIKPTQTADVYPDMSTIDTSFVTLRTPLKPRNYINEDSMGSGEAAIMEYVNDLMAVDEENIVQECQMRCKRLIESRQNTHKALANALDAIEVLDDDILDNSVQIIESPIECLLDGGGSDSSVQMVAVEKEPLYDSDVEIIDFPSTSRPQKRAHKHKGGKKKLTSQCTSSSIVKVEIPDDESTGKKKGINDCSICLEPLQLVKEISSTTCGHIFCTACIKDVIKRSKKCPICRSALTLKKIHPLFLF